MSIRVVVPGEAARAQMRQVIDLWCKVHPAQAKAFASQKGLRKRQAEESLAGRTDLKGKTWNLAAEIPEQIVQAIAVQLGSVADPLDWIEDPKLLRIFQQEFSQGFTTTGHLTKGSKK